MSQYRVLTSPEVRVAVDPGKDMPFANWNNLQALAAGSYRVAVIYTLLCTEAVLLPIEYDS